MQRISRALAAELAGVQPATVRAWIHRGHLTNHPDGIDVRQLIDWLDSRDPHMLAARAGLRGEAHSATAVRGNRAARLLAQTLTLKRRKMADPEAYDTPDPGDWLRPRRI